MKAIDREDKPTLRYFRKVFNIMNAIVDTDESTLDSS